MKLQTNMRAAYTSLAIICQALFYSTPAYSVDTADCKSLAALIKARGTGFSNIKGAIRKTDGYTRIYDSSLVFDNAQCRVVFQGKDVKYKCQWIYSSKKLADAAITTLTQDISSCVEKDESLGDITVDTSTNDGIEYVTIELW